MKKVILLIFSVIGVVTSLFSQKTISGRVVDENQKPISGVVVIQQGSEAHTHSDSKGSYSLEIEPNGSEIFFSHLLYKDTLFSSKYEGFSLVKLEDKNWELADVDVSGAINSMNQIVKLDISQTPLSSSQDILKKIPGLFIAQHAGGGKAEQIFLRGFDIDHGTDISLTFDGMPVNMVSHAHGQGYADLHFIIPEVIQGVNFGKGAYQAENGNFNTAGFADFKSKNQIQSNLFQLEYGQFNSLRALGMFKLLDQDKSNAYVAAEYISRDGFFESPQNFHRVNLHSKYSKSFENGNFIEVSGSFFDSEWTASGQIPLRAIDSGLISRLGAIDDTEGGRTSRKSINFKETIYLGEKSYLKGGIYLSQYDFELFSNFTFFLNDPEFGDQIKQSESRVTFGAFVHLDHELSSNWDLNYGLNFRHDNVSDVQLTNTVNRDSIQSFVTLGNVGESNVSGFVSTTYQKGKWQFIPGVRLDVFQFNYEDKLEVPSTNLLHDDVIFSPKFIATYSPNKTIQYAVKFGQGFHSNDTRVAVLRQSEALPKSTGGDLEVSWKVNDKMVLTSALWFLNLDQEFVYVGDEGIVEPSGKSRRKGVDVSARIEVRDGFLANLDFNYTHARSTDGEEFNERIPLAPELTSTGGLSYVTAKGFFGSLNYRILGDRAANEDFSITADGYAILDGALGYKNQHFEFSITAENLLNTEWKEAQFATLSRLQFEDDPVEEIHFTPGTPFFLNAKIGFRF